MLRLVGKDVGPSTPDSFSRQDAAERLAEAVVTIGRILLDLVEPGRHSGGVKSAQSNDLDAGTGAERVDRRALEEDLRAWQTAHVGGMAVATQRQVLRLVREVGTLAGAAALGDITNDHVCEYFASLHDGTDRKKCSGKSITTYQSYLHAFFDWAVQTERIRRNPAANLPKVRWIKKKQRAFTPAEVARLIAASPFEHQCMLRFLAVSGMRPLHAEQLRARSFLLDEDPPRVVFLDTKTRAEREVALDVDTAAMLKRRLAQIDPEDRPFKRLHHEQFDLLLDAAGVAKFDARGRSAGYSGLRRFGPTLAGKLKLDPESMKLQLGHSTLATTMQHYNDADIHSQHSAVTALGHVLSDEIAGAVGSAVGIDLTTKGQMVEDGNVKSASSHFDHARPGRSPARQTSHPLGGDRLGEHGCSSRPADSDRRGSLMGAVGFEPTKA